MKRIMQKWQTLLSVILMIGMLGAAACGGTDTVYVPSGNSGGGDGGTPPPNPNPNPNPQPPPVTTAALSFEYKFCTDIKYPPTEVQMKPSLGWWVSNTGKGSYDSFLIRDPHVENGWTCYGPITVAHPEDTVNWLSKGNLYIATFLGNNQGAFPQFANGGMKKYQHIINGREDPCITVAVNHGPVVNVERDTRTAQTFGNPQPSDGDIDWGEGWLEDCNGGDQNCAIDCKKDIPDDGYEGVH